MTRPFDLITIGGATRDIIFFTDESIIIERSAGKRRQRLLAFPYGVKILSRAAHFSSGGGGCNVAVAEARLGFRVAAFVRVGDDHKGRLILNDFQREGVDTRFVRVDARLQTGFSFLLVGRKRVDHVAFLVRGSNEELALPPKEVKRLRTRWAFVSSLPDKHWPYLAKALTTLSKRGVAIAWNPGEAQLRLGLKPLLPLLRRSRVFIVNRTEAQELLRFAPGIRAPSASVQDLASMLRTFGPEIVAVTDGAHGAAVASPEGTLHCPAVRVGVVDTTGAGDAFGATLVAGLIRTRGHLRRSLRLALANSASVVERLGAQDGLRTWEQLKRFPLSTKISPYAKTHPPRSH